MNLSFPEILNQIEPYKDSFFYFGLTESEISDIENNTGKSFPVYFREFLKIFGVKQDFVSGFHTDVHDFTERTEYLPDDVRKSYVVIGNNGGEDFWLLNTDNPNDTNIYEWQYWQDGEVVKSEHNFETLLQKSILKLSERKENQANSNKNWYVQFAIPTKDEQMIYTTIPLIRTQDWELKEVSPAQVYVYETKAQLSGKIITFIKQEYNGWKSPIYYFNLQEPVSNFDGQSLIKDLNEKLKDKFPEYELIDYGIMTSFDEGE